MFQANYYENKEVWVPIKEEKLRDVLINWDQAADELMKEAQERPETVFVLSPFSTFRFVNKEKGNDGS